MHIGFDISQTGRGKAGCGFYAHSLIRALLEIAPEHRYSLYPSFGDYFFDPFMPLWTPYKGRNLTFGPRHLSRTEATRFWNRPDIEAALAWPDIVHSNNYACPAGLRRCRVIYTLYDLSFAVYPDWTTEANRVGCFSGVFMAARKADWILAISQASRSQFLATFPHFPADRVRVIYPGARFGREEIPAHCPARLRHLRAVNFWLSVGTIEPRKNQRLLVSAYAAYLSQGGPPMPLVLAGGFGWLMEDFGPFLDQLGIRNQVLLLGYATDAEVAWLYHHCFANLYPSLFEGFGLPVLEGLVFSAPTVVSTATSLPEVAGEAALLVDPHDEAAWTASMLRLTRDPALRSRLTSLAHPQARRFTASAAARQLLELYEEALAAPKRPRPRAQGSGPGPCSGKYPRPAPSSPA